MKLDFNIKVTFDLTDEEAESLKSLTKKDIDNKCKPFWNNEIREALEKVFYGQENIKININGKFVKEKK